MISLELCFFIYQMHQYWTQFCKGHFICIVFSTSELINIIDLPSSTGSSCVNTIGSYRHAKIDIVTSRKKRKLKKNKKYVKNTYLERCMYQAPTSGVCAWSDKKKWGEVSRYPPTSSYQRLGMKFKSQKQT